MHFQNLADVHPRRYTQRVQHDVHGAAVCHVRHVFHRQNARYHAFVTVAAGHFVACLQAAFDGNEHFDHFLHARRQLVALRHFFLFHFKRGFGFFAFLLQRKFNQFKLLGDVFVGHPDIEPIVAARQSVQVFRRNRLAFAQFHRTAVGFLTAQHTLDTVKCVIVEDADLVVQILTVAAQLGINNGLGAFIALDAFAREHLHVNHGAAHAGRHTQRSIFHIRRFFAENRTQQFFFGCELGFAFGRYFADQYVAGFHFCTDIDNAAFVQTVLHFFGQVRNIACDVFRTQLGIACHYVQFFNVDRRIAVVRSHFLANQNRVFVVVAVPRHEGDGHVLTERKFAQIGGRTVGNQIAALQHIAFVHGRTLVDVSGLVGTCEFHQIVNIHTTFGCGRFVIMHTHHHAVCVHILHHAATTGDNGSCTVHSYGTFDTRTYQWLLGAQTRHGLTLHVRTHQGTVRIVMLQERNQ